MAKKKIAIARSRSASQNRGLKTQKRSLYKRELSIEEEGVGTRISSVFTRQRLGMSNSEGLGISIS